MTEERRGRRPPPFDLPKGDEERRAAGRAARRRAIRRPYRRLFTATVALAYDRHVLIAFHASVAREPIEVRVRLAARLGEAAAGIARISEGYDEASFIARTVVTPGLRDLLRLVEEEPHGCAADGFDVHHVQVVGVEP